MSLEHMKGHIRFCVSLQLVVLLFGLGQDVAAQNEVVLIPSKDNTLYEHNTLVLSNGAGQHLFAGRTSITTNALRRTLIAFSVASALPDGAVIDSVQLKLHLSKTVSGAKRISVHWVLTDWGEGASDAAGTEGAGTAATIGDATWLHTFFDTSTWQTAGGDFRPIESASTLVAGNGTYTWGSTPELIADVRQWVDAPQENFGWLLLGEEEELQTAKRFDSRENPNPDFIPKLHVYYSIATRIETETIPTTLRLLQNYPNPFKQTTTISFILDAPQHVTLKVFNALGRTVATLVASWQHTGLYQVAFDASDLPPGVYFYRLTGSGSHQFGKMIALR
ncbi:MAG: T9SS type A sorting domain-containing protein [Bacteroidetes bacterium]|nr:T9SS type A sorting domain-containing protein [Bacteroidota bacterium]